MKSKELEKLLKEKCGINFSVIWRNKGKKGISYKGECRFVDYERDENGRIVKVDLEKEKEIIDLVKKELGLKVKFVIGCYYIGVECLDMVVKEEINN